MIAVNGSDAAGGACPAAPLGGAASQTHQFFVVI